MRHAKSSWKFEELDDHSRPLNGRGRRSAALVAQELVTRNWIPDAVWSSDAKRTRETWAKMQPFFPECDVEFRRELYLAGVDEVVLALSSVGPASGCVLALGHNPGWSAFVHSVSGAFLELKTGDAALLSARSAGTWVDLLATPRQWFLEDVVRSRPLFEASHQEN